MMCQNIAGANHASRTLGLVLSLLVVWSTSVIAARPAQAQATALNYVNEVRLSPRLTELTFTTPALATQPGFILGANPMGQTKVRVLLPEEYDQDHPKKRYPVLYLFHGGGGNHTDWTSPGRGDAEAITAGLPLIVVMPEGGIAGGFADWYNNGTFGPPKWQTYHLDQLVPWVDANYRTIAHRKARATAGLSMGGGGLRYAAQRPDLIAVTASFSGDIDITQPASDWRGAGAVISRLIWGDFTTQELRWRGVNGPDLAKNLGNTDVAIFSGDTGRPEGTYIIGGAARTHERLVQFGIAHQYTVFPGMSHAWATFNLGLSTWIPRLVEQFDRGVPHQHAWKERRPTLHGSPSVFTYSAIAPTYSVYDWSIELQRDALEFSAIEVAGIQSFDVIGSGSATVQTPRISLANIQFRAKIKNVSKPELSTAALINTDANGRLTVPISLGPSNPFQQYTAAANAASTGPSTEEVPFLVFNNGSRFYRARVAISITPTGLCQLIGELTSHRGTRTALCALLRDFDKSKSGRGDAAGLLGRFRAGVDGRAGRTLTNEQAEEVLRWSNTIEQ